MLYVGSAVGQAGRLAHTIRRHMQRWTSDRCERGDRSCPGVRVSRYAVEVAVLVMDGRKARKVEKALIAKLSPAYNVVQYTGGKRSTEVPF